jgi:hypothetical protein
MKTALLIVGGERSLERTIGHLTKHMLEPNRPVLFFACETTDPQRVLSAFPGYEIGGAVLLPTFRTPEYQKIVSMCAERPGLSEEVFQRARSADGLQWTVDYIKQSGTLLQYYQLWNAWQLLLDYERAHGMKFDFCVKWRLDILLTQPLILADIPSGQSEEMMRSMGNDYMRSHPRTQKTNPYYEHAYGTPFTDNVVWTLGHDQVFMTHRKNWDCFGSMVFWFGLWDSGGPFAFNSETFFHQMCIHNQLVHWIFMEDSNPIFTHEPDETHMWTILR